MKMLLKAWYVIRVLYALTLLAWGNDPEPPSLNQISGVRRDLTGIEI